VDSDVERGEWSIEEPRVEHPLDAAVAHRSQVARPNEAAHRRREGDVRDGVATLSLIDVELEGDARAEELRVDARLDFRLRLRLEALIAELVEIGRRHRHAVEQRRAECIAL